MQCIRANRRQSSASSTSLSMESINIYFQRNSNRKSFIRRSFELVQKSVVRRSVNLSRRNSKSEKTIKESDDHNNNRHSQGTVPLTSIPGEGHKNTYDGDDILTFSTNSVIIKSNTKKLKRQYSQER